MEVSGEFLPQKGDHRGLFRLMGLMGLLTLWGCSGDGGGGMEPVPQPEAGVAISFGGNMQADQSVTRAETETPLKDQGVTTFTVWGFKNTDDSPYTAYQEVFPGYRVQWFDNSAATTTTNTNGWEYVNRQLPGDIEQTIKYWDWGAYAYRFMAVTGSGVNGKTVTTGSPATTSYELTFDADSDNPTTTPYYSRLWYSEIGNPYKIGKPVTLVFVKPLSYVRFMFIFEDPTDAASTELTDKSFRPYNGTIIKRKGKITVSYPLTGTSTTETVTVSAGAGGFDAFTQDYYESVSKTGDVVTSPYYGAIESAVNTIYTVLPTPDGQSNYILEVNVDGEPKSTMVPAEYMTWLPGYQYTYIFKVHVDGGVTIDSVQSAFTPWIVESKDRTVYNW